MGAGILLLLAGVVALVMLQPSQPKELPPYERTLLYLYDGNNPGGPGVASILEEAHTEGQMVAISFPAPDSARALFKSKSSARQVQSEIEALAGHKLHHRVFLPYQVVEVLINAFGSITVDGQEINGAAAVAYIQADEATGPARALQVMMAISDAAMDRVPNMGVSEGLKLANQVSTDIDLMKIPDFLGRWANYPSPQITSLNKLAPEAVADLLHPDTP